MKTWPGEAPWGPLLGTFFPENASRVLKSQFWCTKSTFWPHFIYVCFNPVKFLPWPELPWVLNESKGGLGGSRQWGPSSKVDHVATFPYRCSERPFFPIWTFHFHIVSYSNRFETAQNNLSRWFWSKYTFSVFYVWMMTQFEDSQNAIFGLQAILINLATFPYRCSGVLNPKKQIKFIFRVCF